MKKPFYITTTLPYVNAEPHMGHALEFVRADIIARWKTLSGYDVFFNTGTDEHGQKLFESAQSAGKDVQTYVDENAEYFKRILPALGISSDIHFIRTTDAHHESAAQEFWRRVAKNGYIYKKNYKTRYCVGCEEEKTDSELIDGRCAIHPQRELEVREEENYFFKFSAFGKKLLDLYDKKGHVIVPDFRMNEMREFIKADGSGLQDFSISRLRTKMEWGIGVPDDPDHVMYVWFDALVNYISTLGWPEDTKTFKKYWQDGTPTQYCGKDNTRFQSVMWQAMLLAADLPPTQTVVVNGFITGEGGVKMSKSLGNVINPMDIVSEYGTEALRYFLAREVGSFEDSPFTLERFKASYNSGLANGLGNLVSRVMKMATTYGVELSAKDKKMRFYGEETVNYISDFDITSRINDIWVGVDSAHFKSINLINEDIQNLAPFKKIKTSPEEAKKDVYSMLYHLLGVALALEPFMPETAQTIQTLVRENRMPDAPLFLRKD